jgi:hypothetical protein
VVAVPGRIALVSFPVRKFLASGAEKGTHLFFPPFSSSLVATTCGEQLGGRHATNCLMFSSTSTCCAEQAACICPENRKPRYQHFSRTWEQGRRTLRWLPEPERTELRPLFLLFMAVSLPARLAATGHAAFRHAERALPRASPSNAWPTGLRALRPQRSLVFIEARRGSRRNGQRRPTVATHRE